MKEIAKDRRTVSMGSLGTKEEEKNVEERRGGRGSWSGRGVKVGRKEERQNKNTTRSRLVDLLSFSLGGRSLKRFRRRYVSDPSINASISQQVSLSSQTRRVLLPLISFSSYFFPFFFGVDCEPSKETSAPASHP